MKKSLFSVAYILQVTGIVSVNYSKRITSLAETAGNSGSLVPFQPPADTLTYEPFFGLIEKPFSLNSDSRFVFESPTYGATRDSLLAGIRRREGLHVLTGEIGTGKTTLCHSVLRHLGRKTYSSMVPDPFASREDLLKMLLIDFGVVSIQELSTDRLRQASRTELSYLLSEFLDSLTADAFAVVMIDEAQNLTLPLIEETRILSDAFGASGRLQIVFVGQPELHAKLKLPEMRQVDQRVCGYHRLSPLSRAAVDGYIQHRLVAAGGRPDRVRCPAAIIDALHQRTGGVPRLINRLCDRALLLAYQRRAELVDREILETVLIEVGSATLSPTWDSIIFSETPSSSVAVVAAPESTPDPMPEPDAAPATASASIPAAVAAAPAEARAPIEDGNFAQQIDQWVKKDLAPPSRALSSLRMFSDVASPRLEVPAHRVATERRRERRPETYMQKGWRTWAKRAAIAVVALMTVVAALAGASLLAGTETAPVLPTFPEAPVAETPATAAPVTEVPVTSDSVAVSANYLVAVGLFASPARADQLVDTLTQAGLPAMQRPFQMRRQEVQQIVLGPFFSRADADADLQRLKALGGYDDATVVDSSREP